VDVFPLHVLSWQYHLDVCRDICNLSRWVLDSSLLFATRKFIFHKK
jgi:hypothetical protein